MAICKDYIELNFDTMLALFEFWKTHTEYICECCKYNTIPCGADCKFYTVYKTDANNNPIHTCMDNNECEAVLGAPCRECFNNNLSGFEWNSKVL